MTPSALAFMIVAWTAITSLTIWCLVRLMSTE